MMHFHLKAGSNVQLLCDRKVALRTKSFANAIAFSHRPLEPGEMFLFEIEDIDHGWAGHIRCGITQHNPKKIDLPQYLLPDFQQLGKSWVFAIKPCKESPFGDERTSDSCLHQSSIHKCSELIECHVNQSLLCNKHFEGCLPTAKGSRIGFFVTSSREMYFVINGMQYGPCARDMPLYSLYAVVDLYGTTKRLKIIDGYVPLLKTMCTDYVRRRLTDREIEVSPLPRTLKLCISESW